MKRYSLIFLAVILLFAHGSFAQEADTTQTDMTKIGDLVPAFKVETTCGKTFDSQKLDGNVTLINFFATWCGPCNAEMPHLEKEIWQGYKDKGLTVISIGREHSADEVQAFKEKKELTFAMAPDPERTIYKKFATMYIPRNYILDKDGHILYQHKGFNNDELKKMIKTIETQLDD